MMMIIAIKFVKLLVMAIMYFVLMLIRVTLMLMLILFMIEVLMMVTVIIKDYDLLLKNILYIQILKYLTFTFITVSSNSIDCGL